MTAARIRRRHFPAAKLLLSAPPAVSSAPITPAVTPISFVAERLQEARAMNLWIDEPLWQTALQNYMLVAYHTDRGGPRAWPMAHYQQFVAYIDEAIFDAQLAGETHPERVQRLSAVASYLVRVVRGATPLRTPRRGGSQLKTAATAIQHIRRLYQRDSCEPIFVGWVRNLTALLRASVEEHRRWPCARPHDCPCHANTPLQQRVRQALERAPTAIIAELSCPAALLGEHADLCPTILLRLCCTAASIGAGGLFWSAALVRTHHVTDHQRAALDEACSLLDFLVRLDNDLSDAIRLRTGDRDGKINCVTIAAGSSTSVNDRVRAIKAAQACRAWLNDLFEASLARLIACWSELGTCVARGAAIGEAVYTQLGHFKEVSPEQMADVARGLDERWR